MNLVLELTEIEKQVSALISENINLKKENKELAEQNTSLLTSVENLNKSVQELEKENAELEHQLTHRNCLDCSNHSSKLRMRTLELEKENAELKHTIATLRQEKDNVSMHAKAMEVVAKTRSDQLTKSKEIIRYLCEMVRELSKLNPQPFNVEYSLKEADQFLKE